MEVHNKQVAKAFLLALGFVCFVVGAAAQSVVTTLNFRPPGVDNQVGFDFEVAVVESTGLVYVGSTGAYGNLGKVGVVDPATKRLIKTIVLPDTGTLAFSVVNQSTKIIYFRYQDNRRIAAIDGNPSSPTFHQAFPTLTGFDAVVTFAVDPVRNRLYVSNDPPGLGAETIVIDADPSSPSFHTVLATVPIPGASIPLGIAVNPSTNKIYVGAFPGAGVRVLDGLSLTFTEVAGTAPGIHLVANENSNLVYAGAPGNQVLAIDGTTDMLLAVIPIPGEIFVTTRSIGEYMSVNRVTGRIYVRTAEENVPVQVIVIDGDRLSPSFNTVLATVPLGLSAGSTDIVVDEGRNRVLTTTRVKLATWVIDGATNTVAAEIPSTQLPSDVAVNPNVSEAYSANQLNFVQAISTASDSLTATILTGTEVFVGAANSATVLAYGVLTTDKTGIFFLDKNATIGTVSGIPDPAGRYVFMALNRATGLLYVVNSSASALAPDMVCPGFVSVVDASTNSVVANISVGDQPFGIGLNESTNKIYVLNAGLCPPLTSTISVIDGFTHAAGLADTTAFSADARFLNYAVVNQTSNKMYFQVIGIEPTTIGVLDGFTDVATPLPASLGPLSPTSTPIAVSNTLNRTYIASRATGVVHVLDSATDAEIATVPTGSPAAVAVNETTGHIYVTNSDDNTLTVIDGPSNNILATVPVGAGPNDVTVNELANRVYVANTNDNSISFIDGASNTVTATLNLPASGADNVPMNSVVVADPAVGRVYVSNILNAVIHVLDDTVGTLSATGQAIIDATTGDPAGVRNGMLKKLNDAQRFLDAGKVDQTTRKLRDLADEVEAQRGKALTDAEADRILALIAAVINSVA